MDKMTAGINNMVPLLSHDGGQVAAEAIMTTDSVPKQASFADEGWAIGGMAKGAGMLAPGLATSSNADHRCHRRSRRAS